MQEQLKNIAERLKKIHDWTETHLYELKLKNITKNMNECVRALLVNPKLPSLYKNSSATFLSGDSTSVHIFELRPDDSGPGCKKRRSAFRKNIIRNRGSFKTSTKASSRFARISVGLCQALLHEFGAHFQWASDDVNFGLTSTKQLEKCIAEHLKIVNISRVIEMLRYHARRRVFGMGNVCELT